MTGMGSTGADLGNVPVTRLPVGSLSLGLSPRQAGEDPGHVSMLAEIEGQLPPILVRRQTMQVIDGAHRLRAAILRGETEIDARVVDDDEAASYLLAVKLNTGHGLPLSPSDRKEAARRIMEFFPQWSDRKVAEAAGVAPNTVAAIRASTSAQNEQLCTVGKDGRSRPRDGAQRRKEIRRLLTENPELSVREVAQGAGVSPQTVRNERKRMNAEALQPLEETLSPPSADEGNAWASSLAILQADPAFRSTDNGRLLLRLFASYAMISSGGVAIARSTPEHCRQLLMQAARAYGEAWLELAECISLLD